MSSFSSDRRTANISPRWTWILIYDLSCWCLSTILKAASVSELNSWFLESKLRGTSNLRCWTENYLRFWDLWTVDLNLPDLNLTSARLSLSLRWLDLTYVWIQLSTSVYRWSTKSLLRDVYFSYDAKRYQNYNLRKKGLNNSKTNKFYLLANKRGYGFYTHAFGELIFNQEFRIMRKGVEHRGVELNWDGAIITRPSQDNIVTSIIIANSLVITPRPVTRQYCDFDNNSKFIGNNPKTRHKTILWLRYQFIVNNHEFHWKIT